MYHHTQILVVLFIYLFVSVHCYLQLVTSSVPSLGKMVGGGVVVVVEREPQGTPAVFLLLVFQSLWRLSSFYFSNSSHIHFMHPVLHSRQHVQGVQYEQH